MFIRLCSYLCYFSVINIRNDEFLKRQEEKGGLTNSKRINNNQFYENAITLVGFYSSHSWNFDPS